MVVFIGVVVVVAAAALLLLLLYKMRANIFVLFSLSCSNCSSRLLGSLEKLLTSAKDMIVLYYAVCIRVVLDEYFWGWERFLHCEIFKN